MTEEGGICLVILHDSGGITVKSHFETGRTTTQKPLSGTGFIVQQLAKELVKRNIPVSLLVPEFDEDAANMELIVGEGRVQAIGAVHGKNRSFHRNFQRALELFRRFRPDHIHMHCPHFRWGIEVAVAAGMVKARTVLRTEHNPLLYAQNSVNRLLLTFADAKVRRFVYVSEGNKDRFENYLPWRQQRGVVVPNGIDPTRFSPVTDSCNGAARRTLRESRGWSPDSRVAVFVGTYGGRRSLAPLFEAFHRLRLDPATTDAASRWRFLVIGFADEINERDEREIAANYGLCDSTGKGDVWFDGPSNAVSSILPHCDLFVASSHFEGMSVAYLEAMASGLPLLVTRVDGVTDVVGAEIGESAMPEYDDMDGIVHRWGEYMKNYEREAARFSGIADRVRSEFSVAKMLSRYMELYESL